MEKFFASANEMTQQEFIERMGGTLIYNSYRDGQSTKGTYFYGVYGKKNSVCLWENKSNLSPKEVEKVLNRQGYSKLPVTKFGKFVYNCKSMFKYLIRQM